MSFLKMHLFGICFLLYLINVSAGKGFQTSSSMIFQNADNDVWMGKVVKRHCSDFIVQNVISAFIERYLDIMNVTWTLFWRFVVTASNLPSSRNWSKILNSRIVLELRISITYSKKSSKVVKNSCIKQLQQLNWSWLVGPAWSEKPLKHFDQIVLSSRLG